jgi:biotin carboxyl carrier protein
MSDFVVTINSKKKNIQLSGNALMSVNNREYHQELFHLSGHTYLLKLDNKIYEISAKHLDYERYQISIDGKSFETLIRTNLQERAAKLLEQNGSVSHKLIAKAPMPGMILKIKKAKGDEVIKGESVIILEAMKMENDLRAQVSGRIKDINVKEGMAVEKGFILFSIE